MQTESKYKITPYFINDGVPSMLDSQIMGFYDRIESDNRLYMFKDGSVKSREDFLAMAKSPGTFFYVISEKEPVAVVWLNRFEYKRAYVHFCCFSNISNAVEAGTWTMKQLLFRKVGEHYPVDLFLGMVPIDNKPALSYLIAVGCKVIGEVPNISFDADKDISESGTLIYFTRELL